MRVHFRPFLRHSLTHSRARSAIVALACSAGIALGQVNILSDVINFRTSSSESQTTTHYGMLWTYALTPGGYNSVYGENDATATSGGVGNYGMYGNSINTYRGIGGRFDGREYGLMGVCTSTQPDAIHIGGWFTAGNAATTNYGIYCQTEGTSGTKYSAYFNGSTYCSGGSYLPSDMDLKIAGTPLDSAVAKIRKLTPRTYYYDTLNHPAMNLPSTRQYGLYAEELEQVFPEMVRTAQTPTPPKDSTATARTNPPDTLTFKCVNYTALVPILIAAIQEQQATIDKQEKRIVALEGKKQ